MVSPTLEGITVLADDVDGLARFYERALDLPVTVREENYVAFAAPGMRLAIFRRKLMGDHASFHVPRGAQAFELNFECTDAAAVDLAYLRVLDHGAAPIATPVATDWGHYTAFFADPEGNIHSLFAVLRAPGILGT